MDRLKTIINNPKVLLALFVFLVIPVVILLLSLLKIAKPQKPGEALPTPTQIPLKIPEGEEIPTPIIQMPPNVLINMLRDVSFQFPDQSFPAHVKIYKAVPTPIDSFNAQKISESLLFKNAPAKRLTQTDTVLSFKEAQRQLIISLKSGNIEYFNPESKISTEINSSQEAMIAAKDFIKVFSPYSETLDPNPSDISYYLSSAGDLRKLENFNETDILDIPFIQKVNGLTIYAQFGSGTRAHVWIHKEKGIIKVTLKTNEVLAAEGEDQVLSLNEAKNKIEEGAGTIVLYGEDYHGKTLPPPIKTIFTTVKLAYFKDNLTNFLYPIFVFSGTAQTNDGGEEKIIVYLPAAK